MSKSIAATLAAMVRGGTAWMKPYRRVIARTLVAEHLIGEVTVDTPAGPLRFHTPTARSAHDPLHLYQDEPETIAWIDGLPRGEVLWDIGANVGVFTVYAAKTRGLRVLAFEPGAASFAALTRNVEINGLETRADAYCLAFAAATGLDYLHMANTGAGHSMHAFGQAETVQGQVRAAFRQAVPGFTADDFQRIFQPPPPDHIKLDVDSIELDILKGAAGLLRDRVKTVLVEVYGKDRDPAADGIAGFLAAQGFTMNAGTGRNVLFHKSPGGAK